MSSQSCILCGAPIRVMCQIGTGYCCQRHQEEGERRGMDTGTDVRGPETVPPTEGTG